MTDRIDRGGGCQEQLDDQGARCAKRAPLELDGMRLCPTHWRELWAAARGLA